MRRAGAFTVLTVLIAGGCSDVYWTSNVREAMSLPSNGAIATNADVRLVHRFQGREVDPAVNPDGTPKMLPADPGRSPRQALESRPREYLCAEPSPDVARVVQAALSNSLGVAGTVTPPTGGTAVEGQLSAQLNASRSEGIAQLTKRIATIQLLRDGLYRACEAYANGAIGPEIYTAIISRYDRMMITMLMGEMAAGNFGSAAILGGSSSGSASADASLGSGGRLDAAQRRLAAARRDQTEQNTIVGEQEVKTQGANANLQKAPEDPQLQATFKSEQARLDAAKANKTIIDQEATDADSEVKAAQAAASNASGPIASARGRSEASSTGSISTATSPVGAVSGSIKEVAEVLARMQRSYLNDPPMNTMMLMCFSELARPEPVGHDLRERCREVFQLMATPAAQGMMWDTSARPQLREIDNASLVTVVGALKDKLSPEQLKALLGALRAQTDTPTGAERPAGRMR